MVCYNWDIPAKLMSIQQALEAVLKHSFYYT